MSCGCVEPSCSTVVKCPIALKKKLEHCEGLEMSSSSILGDVPCEKCAALVGGVPEFRVDDIQTSQRNASGVSQESLPLTTLPSFENGTEDYDTAFISRPNTSAIPPVTARDIDRTTRSLVNIDGSQYEVIIGSTTDAKGNPLREIPAIIIGGSPNQPALKARPCETIGPLKHYAPSAGPWDGGFIEPIAFDGPSVLFESNAPSVPLQFDAPPKEVKDASEKETLTEAVEKIVEFVEETRDVDILHHKKQAGHVLEHGESVTLKGVVSLDDDTSAEVKVKVTKD